MKNLPWALARGIMFLTVLALIPACSSSKPTSAILVSPSALHFSAVFAGAPPVDQTVSVSGSTGLLFGETSWTAATDQSWLAISPPSGTTRTGETRTLSVHVTYAPEQWLGPTSTIGAPATGCGVWTGSAMLIWTGDAAVPGKFYDPVSDTWFGSTSTVNAPSTRLPTTAVWTGTEMIIWGGLDFWGGTALNTGGRYNPATDTWTPTSTVGAPAARFSHCAVWTGTHMIVWGGDSGGYSYKNTGGIYDPATDTWVGATTLTNAPSPRGNLAAVWTGTRMLIWGGEDPSKFNAGYFYNPVTNAWTGTTTTTGAPSARSHLPGVWTGSEMIVWGGGEGGPHLNTGGRYSPTTDSWAATTTVGAPAGRASPVAVWTGDRMIIWGGEINGPLTNTGGIYRPPNMVAGTTTAVITITPDQGPPVTVPVSLTITP